MSLEDGKLGFLSYHKDPTEKLLDDRLMPIIQEVVKLDESQLKVLRYNLLMAIVKTRESEDQERADRGIVEIGEDDKLQCIEKVKESIVESTYDSIEDIARGIEQNSGVKLPYREMSKVVGNKVSDDAARTIAYYLP